MRKVIFLKRTRWGSVCVGTALLSKPGVTFQRHPPVSRQPGLCSCLLNCNHHCTLLINSSGNGGKFPFLLMANVLYGSWSSPGFGSFYLDEAQTKVKGPSRTWRSQEDNKVLPTATVRAAKKKIRFFFFSVKKNNVPVFGLNSFANI